MSIKIASNPKKTLSGDVTGSGITDIPTTLATVNSNVGSFGTASSVPTVTVNAKGLTTAASNTSIQITESQVTNLVSDLAAKEPIVLPTTNQLVYVNALTGNDTTGTGTYAAPYATVIKAMTTITDATINKPYTIMLQSNRQIETGDLLIKPYVFIVGAMQRATYFRVNSGSIKPDTSHSSGTSWVGLSNLYLGGSTVINWDLQALGGSNCTFVVQNCTLSGSLTYKGRNSGGGDFLELYTGVLIGNAILDSVYVQMQSMEFGGTTTLTNSQAVAGITGTWNNIAFDSNVSITSAGTAYLNNCAYSSGVTLTTSGTVQLTSYRGLPAVAQRSLSGGTTVTHIDDTASISPTQYAVVISSDTTALAKVSPSATTGVPLVSAGSSANPVFGQLNLASSSAVTGTLAVANGGTGVTSSTGSGSVVLSASPTLTGTLSGAAATFTGQLGVIAAPGASDQVGINGTSTSASSNQRALNITFTGNASATGNIVGASVALTTPASVAVGTAVVNYASATVSVGGGGSITRFIGLRELAAAAHPATNNAAIADNTAFSGNWFINQSGTDASSFGGSVSMGGLLLPTSSPPASAGATGVTGTITWDSGFIYVCVATNTWKRVAIATW